MASLTLLLHIMPDVSAAQEQRGVWMLLPQRCSPDLPLVYDNRDIVVSVKAGGEMLINSSSFTEGDLLSKTKEIFETRTTKHLFLVGDPTVPFGLIAGIAAELKAEVPYLNVVLLTTHEAMVEGCTTMFDPMHNRYTVPTPPLLLPSVVH